MKRLLISAAVLVLSVGLLVPEPADAQTTVKLGPRLGIPVGDVEDIGGNLFLGVDARFQTDALPVVLNPSIDFYLMDEVEGTSVDQSVFTIDLNALYEFGVDNEVFTPYAGGGIGITRVSTDENLPFREDETDVGLNVVGGARFPLESVEPFVQLNALVGGDYDRLGITGGLLISL